MIPAGSGRAALGTAKASALFLRRGVSNPQQICSVMPSSPFVGRAMVRAIANRPAETVVELGAGTGPVTRELLASGIPRDRLVLVELDRRLAAFLRSTFSGIEVVNAPAQTLAAVWQRDGRPKVGGVVSTLPLRIFDPETVDAVLRSAFEILAPNGCFVQFTYRFVSPVAQDTIERFGLVARRSEIVWANLPPASIWVYSRAQ